MVKVYGGPLVEGVSMEKEEPSLGEMVKCMQLIVADAEEALRYARSQEAAARGEKNERLRQCWMKVIARLESTIEARKRLEVMNAELVDRLTRGRTSGSV